MRYRITPILAGVRAADQGIMTYQHNYGKPIWLPMWSFLVQSENMNILVDTGLDAFVTPEAFTRETGLEPQYLEDALGNLGLSSADIQMVINTHLHDDHCGNNILFPHAPCHVQAREVDFCRNPHPIDQRYDEELIENCDLRLLDGDTEILPGIRCVFTPGHTPGGQAVQIDTHAGQVVIPGFCCNAENFPSHGGAICPGVHLDSRAAYDSAQAVRAMKGIILPLHDLNLADRLHQE